ncbi:MAG TPA: hypothetical protein VGA18_02750 [Rhodothermales bacterium]
MKRTLLIEPLPSELDGSTIRRACKVTRIDGDAAVDETILWYKLPAGITYPDDTDCDSYLINLLLEAASEGRGISIAGSVSADLLGNLDEFQAAWHHWLPERYHVVEINAQLTREDRRPLDRAVCAFSGGVDGAFTTWRHVRGTAGHRTQRIAYGVHVHGFDIPLADREAFAATYQRCSDTLADVGIDLLAVETNFREISKISWEQAFGCALAAVMRNFRLVAGAGLIGSERPYSDVRMAWGSTPLTDHLLGSGEFRIIHDGASRDRTEKVVAIAEWPAAVNSLRVCWKGRFKDRNCGECEKCLRTILNFKASGLPVPDCLPQVPHFVKAIRSVQLKRDTLLTYWEEICRHAKANGVDDPWLHEARRITRKYRRRKFLRSVCAHSPTIDFLVEQTVRRLRRAPRNRSLRGLRQAAKNAKTLRKKIFSR